MRSWVNAQWFRDASGSMKFFKGGELDEGALMTEIPADIVIPWRAYYLLKEWMIENDADRIVHTNRDEDLKIIHRTLDIIQSLSEKARKEE